MKYIKFRIWDTKTKEMVYRDDVPGEGFTVWDWDGDCHAFIYDTNRYKEDLILLEYTGLKDRNKRNIYDGDIIRYMGIARPAPEDRTFVEQGKNVFVVAYHLNRFIGDPVFYINDPEYFGGSQLEDWLISDDREVIGNIWENPELIN